MILLPVLAFILWWAQRSGSGREWRDAFSEAACLWGVWLWACCELLSRFRWLTAVPVAAAWALLALLALAARAGRGAEPLRSQLVAAWRGSSRAARLTVWVLAVAGLVTLLNGLLSPPNNFDALVYHAARVMHWVQNRSVGFYPTSIQRQNHFPPWAEFALLHVRLLTGGDRGFHAVAWLAVFGGALPVSRAAASLGGGARAQLMSAIFWLSVPMAIMQAVSTQNDAVAAFWLAILLGAAVAPNPGATLLEAGIAGAALGLALLTKSTAYLFSLPLVALLAWRWLSVRRASALPGLAAVAGLALLINVPHLSRNWNDYGNPLGPDAEETPGGRIQYRVDSPDATSFGLNAIRNLAIHTTPPDRDLTAAWNESLSTWLRKLGTDPDLPRATWQEPLGDAQLRGFVLLPHTPHEAFVGAPLHVLLLLSIAGAAVVRLRKQQVRDWLTIGAAAAGGLLFCGWVRWQILGARLHLPLFLLAAPGVGLLLDRFGRWPLRMTCVALLLPLPWYLGWNPMHPILHGRPYSRFSGYFLMETHLVAPYAKAVNHITELGWREIGFSANEGVIEYPLWVMLEGVQPRFRLEHVYVTNPSARWPLTPFVPDGVLCIGCNQRLLRGDPRLAAPVVISAGTNSRDPTVLLFPINIRKPQLAPLPDAPH